MKTRNNKKFWTREQLHYSNPSKDFRNNTHYSSPMKINIGEEIYTNPSRNDSDNISYNGVMGFYRKFHKEKIIEEKEGNIKKC